MYLIRNYLICGINLNSKLSNPNLGLITDTICCPGMDYCALATARSIPISQKLVVTLIII